MDTTSRDFLCCALLTSLEVCYFLLNRDNFFQGYIISTTADWQSKIWNKKLFVKTNNNSLSRRRVLNMWKYVWKQFQRRTSAIFDLVKYRFFLHLYPYFTFLFQSANTLWEQCKLRSYILFCGMSVKLFHRCARMIDITKDDVELAHFRQVYIILLL